MSVFLKVVNLNDDIILHYLLRTCFSAIILLRDQINELKKQSGQEPMKTMGPAPKKKKRAGKKKSARKKVTYTIKRRKRKD